MKNRDWTGIKCDSGERKVGPELVRDSRDTKQTGQDLGGWCRGAVLGIKH